MEGLGGPEARRQRSCKKMLPRGSHSRRRNRSCTGDLRVHPPHCYIVWRLLPAVHVFSLHDGWCWYVLSIGTAVLHNIIYLDCAKVSKRNQRTNSSAKEEWKKIQNSKNITWKTSKVQENKKESRKNKEKNRVKNEPAQKSKKSSVRNLHKSQRKSQHKSKKKIIHKGKEWPHLICSLRSLKVHDLTFYPRFLWFPPLVFERCAAGAEKILNTWIMNPSLEIKFGKFWKWNKDLELLSSERFLLAVPNPQLSPFRKWFKKIEEVNFFKWK